LAPAIGALVGIGSVMLYKRRDQFSATTAMAVIAAGTSLWQFILLDRDSTWMPWIRYTILITGIAAALLLLVISRMARAVGTVVAMVALLSGLGGSAAYAIATSANTHSGSIPSAGPASAGSGGFGGGGGRGGNRPAGGFGGGAGTPPTGGFGGGTGGAGTGTGTGGTTGGTATGGTATGGTGTAAGGTGRTGGGTAGGLLDATKPSAAVIAALKLDASKYKWVAATIGSNNAAGYQLYTGKAVMPIGGFNGSDPSPTLAQFQADVAKGEIHYFIPSGTGGLGTQQGGSSVGTTITSWVESHYKAVTIGTLTVYDLTQPTS
jgi:hypothetical protein